MGRICKLFTICAMTWMLFIIRDCSTFGFYDTGSFLLDNAKKLDGELDVEFFKRVQCYMCPTRPSYSYCNRHAGDQTGAIPLPLGCQLCEQCSTDALCSFYSDCCPGFSGPVRDKSLCSSTKIKHPVDEFGIRMIAKCLNDDVATDINKDKCESPNFSSRDLDIRIPVTSNNTLTFRNKYCALCNEVTSFAEWSVGVTCDKKFPIPSSKSFDEVMDMVWDKDNCEIHIEKPHSFSDDSFRTCYLQDTDSFISACNVTGHWTKYDRDIENACLAYKQMFMDKYRNVFCFICNTNGFDIDFVIDSCHFRQDEQNSGVFTSFSAILNFNIDDEPSMSQALENIPVRKKCGRGSKYDVSINDCREIKCPNGKWWKEGKCKKIVNTFSTVEYYVTLGYRLDPQVIISHCDPDVRNPIFMLTSWMEQQLGGPEYTDMYTKTVQVYGLQLHSLMTTCEEEIVNGSHTIRVAPMETIFGVIATVNYTMKDGSIIETLQESIADSMSNTYFLTSEYLPQGNVSFVPDRNIRETSESVDRGELSNIGNAFIEKTGRVGGMRIDPIQEVSEFIEFTRMIFCPFIHLTEDEFELLDGGALLHVNATGDLIGSEYFELINISQAMVCAEQYFNLLPSGVYHYGHNASNMTQNSDGYTTEGILSLVCSCLSIACLAATFIVYALVKSLRSLPGLNNMSLTITLMLAQISFQFGAGQRSYEFLCQILGGLIHYFWLAAVLWMSMCSLHMFRVFGGNSVTTITSKIRTCLKYALVAHLLPLVFVAINIAVSLSESDGRQVGYMGELCFLADRLMVGLLFALPVGVLVFSNIVMFIVVVVSINRHAKSSSFAVTDRQYLHVYFRLSTITGVTWVFGFIYQWTAVEAFSYLFIIFNASQGVFLFMAFICNKNTFSSLRSLRRKRKGHSQYNTGTSAASTKVSFTSSKNTNGGMNANASIGQFKTS